MIQSQEVPIREKNIVLIGFMGVGKTTIGQLVAKKLYRDFIDIDEEINQSFDLPTTEIFRLHGEAEFRRVERETIVHHCAHSRLKVIALGGGAYMQEEVRRVCLDHCIVFLIDLSWDSWKDRLPLILDSRPVLQNKTLEEIEELFLTRKAAYSLHNSRVDADQLEPEKTAEEIVQSIKTVWDIYQPHHG
ncbi:shikimate kinase [Desmospora activa]|uniref:shikimate kinase n=1 Tax=Desmospora activa TaxID=500615 RepID=UPI003CCB805B